MNSQSVYDPALGWEPKKEISGHIPDFRDGVMSLQESMLEQEQVECPVIHHFSDGSYAREIFMPAGTLVVGKIHRHSHMNVISFGECHVLTENGVEFLRAPITFVSLPETKRVVYCVTDVIWTTIHVTESKDIEEIERQIIAPTFNDLDVNRLSEVMPCLG